MTAKYQYAKDSHGKLVKVNDLNRSTLPKSAKFYSIDYGEELRPRLGKIRIKHFAHKPNMEYRGSKETYLHALSKQLFYNSYKECLQSGEPFYVPYKTHLKCDRLKREFGFSCYYEEDFLKFDISQHFTEISMEKRDDGLIPDVLISSPSSGQKIYVEIKVTHGCSEEKINSGIRIMEFDIQDEQTAAKLIDFKLGKQCDFLKTYNFRENTTYDSLCGKFDCKYVLYHFMIFKSGKSIQFECDLHKLRSNQKKYRGKVSWENVVRSDMPTSLYYEDFYDFNHYRDKKVRPRNVFLAVSKNVNIKSCYLCKHHNISESWYYDPSKDIYCFERNSEFGSNEAHGCEYYKFNPRWSTKYDDSNHPE